MSRYMCVSNHLCNMLQPGNLMSGAIWRNASFHFRPILVTMLMLMIMVAYSREPSKYQMVEVTTREHTSAEMSSPEGHSPVMFTQPISDEENSGHGNDVSKHENGHAGVKSIQYKGQPAWQLLVGGIQLIHRMEDLTFNWDGVVQIIKLKGDAEFDENTIHSLPLADENGDVWVSNEKTAMLLDKYGLAGYLDAFRIIESPEKKRVNIHQLSTVEESPSKKVKLERFTDAFVVVGGDDASKMMVDINSDKVSGIYEQELPVDGKHTLPPLSDDSVVNENSKVILSSLFLPYQENVTLSDVLKNACSVKKDEMKDDSNEGDVKSEQQQSDQEQEFDESQIMIDVPIDDNGQCALHLAATLGRVKLVKELISRGANRFRGDNDGQTALMRIVHATNVFELGIFDQLLDLFHPTAQCLDNRGRTVLHHIALTCGLKGRYDASIYYLETLLEWIVKKGTQFALPLSDFIKNVLNIQDKYGNTCLNYASLAGNKYIVSQLLDIGADPYKANKVGVTPGDWGIKVDKKKNGNSIRVDGEDAQTKQSPESVNNNEKRRESGASEHHDNQSVVGVNGAEPELVSTQVDSIADQAGKNSNSLDMLNSIQTYLTSLGKDFRTELTEKSTQIDKLNPILREKTFKLSQKRKQFDDLQKKIKKMSKITNQIDNLNKAIEEEEQKFQNEVKNLNIDVNEENYLGRIDADQPFTIPQLYDDVNSIVERILEDRLNRIKDVSPDDTLDEEKLRDFDILKELESIDPSDILNIYKENASEDKLNQLRREVPPSVVLEARIAAYARNNEILTEKMKTKTTSNKELESQFKRIIGLCIGTDPVNIDDKLLSNLLMSVETDPDPEINQIKKVLKIVGDNK